ncbi:MAG: hypothetical protein Q9205_002178 [Flavoplaca limonia]
MCQLQLPNEIVLLILKSLSKERLKRTRLVCENLADFGASLLMDVVYISPRSEDTEHPTFSAAIKHVVYDTAKVVHYDLEDYYNALMMQLDQKEYDEMRNKNNVMQELMELESKRSYFKAKRGIFKMFKNSPECMKDYHQYCRVPLGQDPSVNSPGSLASAKGYESSDHEAEMDTKDEAHHDTSNGDEDNENEDENDEWEDWNSSDTEIYSPLADAPGLRMDELELHGLSALSIVGLRMSYRDLVGVLFLKLPNLDSLSLSYVELMEGGIWENVVEGLRQRKHMKKCALKSPLSYGHPYDTYPPGLFNNALEDVVLSVNSDYIVYGGRHPSLQRDEVDSASLKYLESLDQALNKIHKAFSQ